MVQAFKAGDIVRLKSGSPTMMLTSVDHRGYVRTAWVVGTDTRHGDFHLDALLGALAEAPSVTGQGAVRHSRGPSSWGRTAGTTLNTSPTRCNVIGRSVGAGSAAARWLAIA